MSRLILFPKRTYLVTNLTQKFHMTEGFLTPAQLSAENGAEVISSTGVPGTIVDADFTDEFSKVSRQAQIMIPKDIGWIVSATGLDKTKTVVDAGSGSGGAASFLSRYAKRVYSYDVRQDHLVVAKKNAEKLGVTNVDFELHDVCQGIPKKNVHLVLLDMPEPWNAIDHAAQAVVVGGYVVTYSPSVTQSQQAVVAASKTTLAHVRTVEIIEREWTIDERRCRPAHGALGHTGFLSLFRRLRK